MSHSRARTFRRCGCARSLKADATSTSRCSGELRHVLEVLAAILKDGKEQGVFRPAHPFVTQMGIMAPLMFFAASAPVRLRVGKKLPPALAIARSRGRHRLRQGLNTRCPVHCPCCARFPESLVMTLYRSAIPILICAATAAVAGCRSGAEEAPPHATGYVEATDVRVATKVSGRVATVNVTEGARIEAGAVVATTLDDGRRSCAGPHSRGARAGRGATGPAVVRIAARRHQASRGTGSCGGRRPQGRRGGSLVRARR